MNVKQLKDILSTLPDEYEVEISINEEGDTVSHTFIDSDNGVIELSNFKDNEEGELRDMFDNVIDIGTKVLYEGYMGLSCGTVINISEHSLLIKDRYTNGTFSVFLDFQNDKMKLTRVIKYSF